MRYTTTDGPKKPLNAIQEGSLGDKMGIAERTGKSQSTDLSLDQRMIQALKPSTPLSKQRLPNTALILC